MVCVAGKAFAQLGVLCGYANGAGVEVAFTHEDTTFHYEGGGGESPFFCAKKCCDGDVSSCFHLTVGLEGDAAAELIAYEGLVGFGETEFPGQASVADGAYG